MADIFQTKNGDPKSDSKMGINYSTASTESENDDFIRRPLSPMQFKRSDKIHQNFSENVDRNSQISKCDHQMKGKKVHFAKIDESIESDCSELENNLEKSEKSDNSGMYFVLNSVPSDTESNTEASDISEGKVQKQCSKDSKFNSENRIKSIKSTPKSNFSESNREYFSMDISPIQGNNNNNTTPQLTSTPKSVSVQKFIHQQNMATPRKVFLSSATPATPATSFENSENQNMSISFCDDLENMEISNVSSNEKSYTPEKNSYLIKFRNLSIQAQRKKIDVFDLGKNSEDFRVKRTPLQEMQVISRYETVLPLNAKNVSLSNPETSDEIHSPLAKKQKLFEISFLE